MHTYELCATTQICTAKIEEPAAEVAAVVAAAADSVSASGGRTWGSPGNRSQMSLL